MTMPELLHDALRGGRRRPRGDWCRCAGSTRPTGPSTPTARAPHPRRHGRLREEIRAKVGEADAAAFDRFLGWLEQLYETEMPHFIDHNFDSPLDLCLPATAARLLLRLGGLRRARAGRRRFFADERLHRSSASRRCTPGSHPPRRRALLRGHHLHGHRRGRVVPRGRHARRAAGMARAAAATPGSPVTRRRGRAGAPPLRGPSPGSPRPTASACGPTPSCAPSTCRSPTTACCPGFAAPRAVRSGDFSPSAVVWHVGARAPPAAARRTTTSTSATTGSARSRRSSTRRS